MKKIIVADYLGNSNKKGEPSGHLIKVLNETNRLLSSNFILEYIVADNYVKIIDEKIFVKDTIKRISSAKNKISEIFIRFRNIKKILKNNENVWFINIDFWLFFFLFFIRVKNKKIFTTNYINYEKSAGIKWKIKKFFYLKANSKVKVEFFTSGNKWQNNQVFIPDYYFEENLYKEYNNDEAKNELVCFCGGISTAKDVKGTINAFNNNNQKLLIIGKFASTELYEECKKDIKENIEINNIRLEDNEYYKTIATSKFVILPYKKEYYTGRSSGIILEAVFLNTIVIAPNFLLKELNISGIGYENIEELDKFNISNISETQIKNILEDNAKIKKKYSRETILKSYIETFTNN